MVQGGWKTLGSIMLNYRANDPERQARAVEAATGSRTKDPDPDDELPRYG